MRQYYIRPSIKAIHLLPIENVAGINPESSPVDPSQSGEGDANGMRRRRTSWESNW